MYSRINLASTDSVRSWIRCAWRARADLLALCAPCIMAIHMECHCLRPGEVPRTSRLFTTFLEDFGKLAKFYFHAPTKDGIVRAAGQISLDDATRRSVVEVLREQNRRLGTDGATARSLDRLAAGAAAIVTGQQVGLFTGPSYSIYKALAALRLAAQMTARGTATVPVFWLATEDHDLAEIN